MQPWHVTIPSSVVKPLTPVYLQGATDPFVSARCLAQRRRREHERAAGIARAVVPTTNARSEGQRRRRERERLQRSALQTTDLDAEPRQAPRAGSSVGSMAVLPTPPPTAGP
jgi:hypothetical protein